MEGLDSLTWDFSNEDKNIYNALQFFLIFKIISF